jgi:hypothetical protein
LGCGDLLRASRAECCHGVVVLNLGLLAVAKPHHISRCDGWGDGDGSARPVDWAGGTKQ